MRQISPAVARCRTRWFRADRIGIVIGTSTSGIERGEEAIAHLRQHGSFPADYEYTQQEPGAPAEFLAGLAQVTGPAYTVSTACSSSAKVFASARNLIELGLCDAVIAGGADALCLL